MRTTTYIIVESEKNTREAIFGVRCRANIFPTEISQASNFLTLVAPAPPNALISDLGRARKALILLKGELKESSGWSSREVRKCLRAHESVT